MTLPSLASALKQTTAMVLAGGQGGVLRRSPESALNPQSRLGGTIVSSTLHCRTV